MLWEGLLSEVGHRAAKLASARGKGEGGADVPHQIDEPWPDLVFQQLPRHLERGAAAAEHHDAAVIAHERHRKDTGASKDTGARHARTLGQDTGASQDTGARH